MICIIMLLFMLALSAHGNKIQEQLSNINKKISQFQKTQQTNQQFSFVKISYFEIQQHHHTNTSFQLFPSINIMQGESSSYPAILSIGGTLYSIKGNQIFKGSDKFHLGIEQNKRSFISTVKNQFTFFAEITQLENKQFKQVSVFKIMSYSKRIAKETEFVTQFPLSYGEITGFSTSFTLSLRLFAFTTDQGNILFYRSNGTIYSIKDALSFQSQLNNSLNSFHHSDQLKSSAIQLSKISNNLVIFSSKKQPFLFTVNANTRKQTIKWYQVPQNCQTPITLKYDENNWDMFYLKCDNKVYSYSQKQTNSYLLNPNDRVYTPRHWYPLLTPLDQFYLAGNLLIVSSHGPQNQSIIFFYNLTQGLSHKLKLPNFTCIEIPKISISPINIGTHIMCRKCLNTTQCYTFNLQDNKTDNNYSNYIKLKIPIIITIFIIIIIITYIKSKNKNNHNNNNNENQEKQFMNFLKNKDLKVFDKLVSTGITNHKNSAQKWNANKLFNKNQ